jgi:hypothetical protein
MNRSEWRARAACRRGAGVDPELFFPPVEVGPLCADQIAAAKSVCGRCPVRPECLRWALDELSDGLAGGLTSEERSQLRARSATGERRPRPVRRPVGGSASEVAAAGRAALREGLDLQVAAIEFGVSPRTVQRWASQVRAESRPMSGLGVRS